ncbi:group II truncated hemoglobin [Spongiibacter sp.]|uniref:group II truncated hemoglobin n=1 Tax=Spongiibacter sp. TaxID=2024860 RepID=UPI003569351D
MAIAEPGYGNADASFKAAGELAGVTALVDAFYDIMDSAPQAAAIRAMHPADLGESRRKLCYFLCGWLGGPRLYQQHYGSINIPEVHQHLAVAGAERDAWLWCMQRAIDRQPYALSFKDYLYRQLCVPAERVRQRSALRRARD